MSNYFKNLVNQLILEQEDKIFKYISKDNYIIFKCNLTKPFGSGRYAGTNIGDIFTDSSFRDNDLLYFFILVKDYARNPEEFIEFLKTNKLDTVVIQDIKKTDAEEFLFSLLEEKTGEDSIVIYDLFDEVTDVIKYDYQDKLSEEELYDMLGTLFDYGIYEYCDIVSRDNSTIGLIKQGIQKIHSVDDLTRINRVFDWVAIRMSAKKKLEKLMYKDFEDLLKEKND